MTALAHSLPTRATNPVSQLGELLALAKSRTIDDRQRLLLGITNLCDAQPPAGELSPVLAEIFLVLARQAERDVRKILSERLAHADWAPRALVNVLALDEIEIARPIIAASPILQDEDLLKILLEATIDHQIEVARRPQLSGRVADAIIDRGEPAGLTALAGNTTAEISGDGLRRLVDQSRRIAALRSPLTRHPRLGDALAQELYRWVGVALRQSIADRFNIDTARLDAEIEAATALALSPPGALTGPTNPVERDEMDRRLIDKLKAADQLRAGYLIRAVREGRLGLFSHGLAALGGFTHGQILQALGGKTPEALYYACAAVGIDRAVFPPLLAEIRKLGSGPQDGSGPAVWLRGAISEASAARSFRALVPADA